MAGAVLPPARDSTYLLREGIGPWPGNRVLRLRLQYSSYCSDCHSGPRILRQGGGNKDTVTVYNEPRGHHEYVDEWRPDRSAGTRFSWLSDGGVVLLPPVTLRTPFGRGSGLGLFIGY
ncbi:hypothetical protein AVEN_150213-1 [Araneus ventricosus]|uniref:Uncharacterized protein n=1 Tax=Araneus ventricosus TaxID=182803 RepID=A0A4Y2QHV0_ARAVE|nr:hypothetical protein AVEN_150213-1 [Araneus ventricosus]